MWRSSWSVLLVLSSGCGLVGYDLASTETDAGTDAGPALLPGPYLTCFDFESLESGEAADISGENRPATCSGTSCPQPTPRGSETGLRFDGVDDFLTLPYAAAFEGLPTAFSFSVWLSADRVPSGPNFHVVGLPFGGGSANAVELFSTPGEVLRFGWDSASSNYVNTPLAPFLDPDPHHLAAVWDGAELCLYVDAVLAECSEGSGPALEARDLIIGADVDSAVIREFWPGVIDDLCVFQRAITTSEIETLAGQ